MSLKNWVMLGVLAVLWGGSFFFVEIALRDASLWLIVWGRVGGAGFILFLYVLWSGLFRHITRRDWLSFVVMGGLNNLVPYSLIAWGQQEITASLASIFNATTPLFTIVLAHFLCKDEKLGKRKLSGIFLGLCGVIVMVGTQALAGIGQQVLAQGAVLMAALSYGLAVIWGRRFRHLNPALPAMGQTVCSTVMMTPLVVMFGFDKGVYLPDREVVLAIAGLAVLCTVVAYVLYFKILQSAGATNLSLVTFLIPMAAMFLGYGFLGERLGKEQIAGFVLILIGLLVIDGRMLRNKRLKSIG